MKQKQKIRNEQKSQITVAADGSLDDEIDPLSEPLHKAGRWVWFQILFFIVQFTLDMLAIAGGFALAQWLRRRIDFGGEFIDFKQGQYGLILGLATAAVLITFYNLKLYKLSRGHSRIDEFFRLVAATLLGLMLAVFLNSFILGPDFLYSRVTFLYAFGLIVLLTFAGRVAFGILINFLRRLGAAQVRILIVGDGEASLRILQRVQNAPELGYRVIGVVCSQSDPEHVCMEGQNLPLLGHTNQLPELIRQHRADELIVTISGASQDDLVDLVSSCDDLPVSIRIYPDAFQLITTTEVTINALTGLPLVSVKDVALRGVNRIIKRGMDIAISALILIFISPIMLLVAMLVKLTDPRGPVFYTQTRVGLDGKPFQVLKFRSMRHSGPQEQPGWTVANDPRRTKIGSFIRRYSVDELPQFINVLIGDMSIVGPRPEQPKYVEQFSQTIPRYMRRHREKSGITGWAQVNGLRGDTSIAERTRYDLYYVENWSVLFDLKIMLKTIFVIFTDKNAY